MDKIRRAFAYIVKDELDKKHRLANLLFAGGALVQIPIALVSFIINVDVRALILQALLAIACWTALHFIIKYPKSQVPVIVSLLIAIFLLLPSLYFFGGGRRSGTLPWMLFGGVCVWILLEGYARYILFVFDVITTSVCMYIEAVSPQTVRLLSNATEETIDTLTCYALVIMLVGVLIDYEIKLYQEKEDSLKQKEKELQEANAVLEKLNEEYVNASAAKSNFLANMSHEIRTPINAILGMDEMILRECEDKDILSYANDIDSAGRQLLSLVNDILDFTKIESGKLELHPVEYELFSVMEDCYNIILLRAKRKELQVLVENDHTLPEYLLGDEVRIRQVVTNLLTNAVKYTRDGYVKLSFRYETVSDEEITLIIEVKDTGIGIPKESLPDLFVEFKRIDELHNRNIEGTGLGLNIVKKLVEMMNGTIEVDSELGVGSTFTVKIPQLVVQNTPMGEFSDRYRHKEYLSDDPYKVKERMQNGLQYEVEATVGEEEVTGASKLKAPKADKNKNSFTAEGTRILVVDDVKMNRNVVRLLLKNTKMEIDLAESGEEALKYTMMKHYDLILMDHMMPDMDGIETFHNIQSQNMGLNNSTKVIVLTANAIQDAQDMYMKEGFCSYITKPVKGEKLEEELIKYLPKDKVVLSEQN